MSYESSESAAATLLTGVTGLSADQVTKGDWRVLSAGHAQAVILTYGGFTQEQFAGDGETSLTWRINAYLCVKYEDDTQVHNDLRDTRQAIIDRLNLYPRLNGASGVYRADVVSGEPTGSAAVGGFGTLPGIDLGAVKYAQERLALEVQELSDFSYGE